MIMKDKRLDLILNHLFWRILRRESEQERREYEKRKNQFEGKLDEIKRSTVLYLD